MRVSSPPLLTVPVVTLPMTLMPAGANVLTIEFKVNFLSPAIGESFLAKARVIRVGRSISVCQGDVFATAENMEKHIATMQATMMTVQNQT